VPATTTRLQILRNGRLVDDFGFGGGYVLTYTDYLLWHSTGYTYEVKALDSGAGVVSDQTAGITTPAQAGSFPRLYSSTSFWNLPIAAAPALDPNSAAMVSKALVPYAGSGNFANSDAWGKPIAYANGVSRQYSINGITFRVPSYSKGDTGSDAHMIVIDASTGGEMDMWQAIFNGSAWSASWAGTTSSLGWGAMCAQGLRCPAADAAGFALAGGVIRPEEIAQGHIDHALFITTPYTRSGYIACPATHTDGVYADIAALPEGARIQLDPAFNVEAQAWPRWEKTIAHALQTYGAYVGDTGGSLAIFGEANIDRGYDAWSLAGVPAGSGYLNSLPWGSFRVLQLQAC